MKRSWAVVACVASAVALGMATVDAPTDANAATATGATATTAGANLDAGAARVQPPRIESIERMCALLTSCPHLPLPAFATGPSAGDVGACVEQMDIAMSRSDAVSFSLTLRECALTATSCDALRTCALRGAQPNACNDRGKDGPVGFCDEAGRAVTCLHNQVVAVRDCPRGNEQCSASGGSATCTLGTCSLGPDGDDAGSAPHCSASGTHILLCDGAHLASIDCAPFGLECVTASTISGGVGCAPPLAGSVACGGNASADAPLRCESDNAVAVGCIRGREVRVDCGAAGMVCNSGSAFDRAVVGFCRLPKLDDAGTSCEKAPSHCEGNAVVSCAFGRTERFACDSAGFKTCVHDDRGARCKL